MRALLSLTLLLLARSSHGTPGGAAQQYVVARDPLVTHSPPPPPPLAVQAAARQAYVQWSKKDQYKYSAVPLSVLPHVGTDYGSHGSTIFHSNMPVSWLVTQTGGGKGAGFSILTQTATHLQLAGTGRAGVWRVTSAALSCLDTCTNVTCSPKTCTKQLGSPACAEVAVGAVAKPGKDCSLAYNVAYYRVFSAWQIGLCVLLALALVALFYYLVVGTDPEHLPGWWWYSDSTSWTVKQAARPAPVPPSALEPRSTTTRLRLDIEQGSNAAAVREAPRMFRSSAEQEERQKLLG